MDHFDHKQEDDPGIDIILDYCGVSRHIKGAEHHRQQAQHPEIPGRTQLPHGVQGVGKHRRMHPGLQQHHRKQAQVGTAQLFAQGNDGGEVHRVGRGMVRGEFIQPPVRPHHLKIHPRLAPGIGAHTAGVRQGQRQDAAEQQDQERAKEAVPPVEGQQPA